ncbi:sugar MFS transporter [Rurimicrobium arvi]|uniref:Sugar MFS transporter n=1 Tax=Rurimicrobium arvi TaxID=2049916 RepID=A0ABP8MXY3_9BACT
MKKNYTFALVVIAALFFVFGFITWSNSQLIPYLKIACELTDTESYLVATAFFAAYFVMGIPSSYVLKLTGFKKGMSLGLLVMAGGALLFVPAANTRNFPLFLTGLFIIGSGLALLQTASNPYATVLGPIESAARRISIMGICNKIAGISAVYILGSIALSDVDALKARLPLLSDTDRAAELNALAQRVVQPYEILALSLALLAGIIWMIRLPEIVEEEAHPEDSEFTAGKTSVLQFPHLVLGAFAIFFYVGVEVISYDTFAGFGEALGFTLEQSKSFATYTGYCLLAGYVFGIAAIPRFISQQYALFLLTLLSIILVLVSMFTGGYVAVVAFALLGFSNSVVWPAIWPLAINHLGRFTKTGSALLIMGIVGGAVLPPLYGEFARAIGSKQLAYSLMIPCYLFILYFAFSGYKLGLKPRKD